MHCAVGEDSFFSLISLICLFLNLSFNNTFTLFFLMYLNLAEKYHAQKFVKLFDFKH